MKQHGAFFARLGWAVAGKSMTGLLISALLVYRLASLVPHLTTTEQQTLETSSRLKDILLVNPLDLPFKLEQWLAHFAPATHAIFFDRLPSAFLALIAALVFIYITRRWYGRRSMVFGAVLFVTSAWFLHVGRFAGLDVLYLAAIPALLAVHVALHDHKDRPLVLYVWLLINMLLLFVPGLVWFVLFSFLLQWRTIVAAWRHLGTVWNRLAWTLLACAGLGLLTYTFVKHVHLLRSWAGLPAHFAPWQDILRRVGESFSALVWHAPYNPELWVGRLPLLDIFVSAMAIVGVAFYITHYRAMRTQLLFGYLVLSGLLIGLGGMVRLSILMPIVYLIATAGTAYALHFWLRTFPRNPIARSFGISLMGCLVLLAAFYNLKLYFVVWPHNPDTQAIESQR